MVTYEVPVETRGLDGGVVTEWHAMGLLWAQVEPLSGRKLELAQRQEPRVTHRVTLRYCGNITPGVRFVMESARVLNVHSVLNVDEEKDETVVLAEEIAA